MPGTPYYFFLKSSKVPVRRVFVAHGNEELGELIVKGQYQRCEYGGQAAEVHTPALATIPYSSIVRIEAVAGF